jgi:glycosyltransferase involved in cell wall biosynthesis
VFERMPSCVTEVIVVDGRSEDETIAVVRALRPDARILVQASPGKGVALACGVAAARGGDHRYARRRRLRGRGRDPEICRGSHRRSRLREGLTVPAGRRERRPHTPAWRRKPLSVFERESAVSHALHRLVLRLQRVLARLSRPPGTRRARL